MTHVPSRTPSSLTVTFVVFLVGAVVPAFALAPSVEAAGPEIKISILAPSSVSTSPGVATTLTFRVTNLGDADDTVSLAIGKPAAWSATPSQTSVPLAVGASADVTVSVVPTAAPRAATVSLTGTSANLAPAAGAQGTVVVPVVVSAALAHAVFFPMEQVKGAASVTFLDGSPVAGAAVLVRESLAAAPSVERAVAVTTGADGSAAFAFPASATGANAPGQHGVLANAVGVPGSVAAASYEVVPTPGVRAATSSTHALSASVSGAGAGALADLEFSGSFTSGGSAVGRIIPHQAFGSVTFTIDGEEYVADLNTDGSAFRQVRDGVAYESWDVRFYSQQSTAAGFSGSLRLVTSGGVYQAVGSGTLRVPGEDGTTLVPIAFRGVGQLN